MNTQENIEFIKKESLHYFDINLGQEVQIQTVCDAYKARKFNYAKYKEKRNKKKWILELQQNIKLKEIKLNKNPGRESIRKEIKVLKEQLTALLMESIERKLKEKAFEGADKPGKYLACKIKKSREKRWINKLKIGEKVIVDQEGIKNSFANYFEKLYQKNQIKLDNIKNILIRLNYHKYLTQLGHI